MTYRSYSLLQLYSHTARLGYTAHTRNISASPFKATTGSNFTRNQPLYYLGFCARVFTAHGTTLNLPSPFTRRCCLSTLLTLNNSTTQYCCYSIMLLLTDLSFPMLPLLVVADVARDFRNPPTQPRTGGLRL